MPGRKTQERLTPKQALWVNARSAGASLADATEAAGYTAADPNTLGAHIAHKPHIQEALARAGTLKNLAFDWTVDGWRNELGSCMRDAATASDLPSRLRALELAGKHLGLLESRGDADSANSAKMLLESLAHLMGKQLQATLPSPSVTIEAHVTEVLRGESVANGSEQGS